MIFECIFEVGSIVDTARGVTVEAGGTLSLATAAALHSYYTTRLRTDRETTTTTRSRCTCHDGTSTTSAVVLTVATN